MSALGGARVLVTRAREDCDALAALIEARGGTAVLLPCIELAGPSNREPLDHLLGRIRAGEPPELIVLASPHAAARFIAEAGKLPAVEYAAVGEATAAVLRGAGARSVVTPAEGAGAEALLPMLGGLDGVRVTLPRAEEGTPELLEGLRARGALVDVVPLYRTVPATTADPAGAAALREGRVDAITFASGSASRGFVALFGPEAAPLANRCAVACIGHSAAEAAKAAGIRIDAVGSGGLPELVDAVALGLERRRPKA